MKKNFVLGMLLGASIIIAIIIALGAIYDCVPSVARMIWPESAKFKEIDIHQSDIFDEEIIGSIPMNYFTKTHVCELWDGEPTTVFGLFTYDFDIEQWIWCQ